MLSRKRIYEIIEIAEDNDKFSFVYDIFMMVTILISLVPLAFKETNKVFAIIDFVTVSIFIADYFLRLLTADYKMKRGIISFPCYLITPMAIIDLVSILPSISIIGNGWKVVKMVRLLRTIKVLRVFKAFRYSKTIRMFAKVFEKQREALLTIFGIAVVYVMASALIILNVEPDTFENYFDAIYWATVSLTTMGYGDIYPVTAGGRIITMISSIVGIAIVAMPAGVITAGFMEELSKKDEER